MPEPARRRAPAARRAAAGAAAAFAFAGLVGLSPPAAAQDRDLVLRAEFPADLIRPPSPAGFSGVVDPSFSPSVPVGEAARAILEEARWVFGAMVWGFEFSYTPSDRARAIEERFELRPRLALAWGSRDFRFGKPRLDGSVVIAPVEWNLDSAARAEYQAWRGSRYASGQGLGYARFDLQPDPAEEAGDGGPLPQPVAARRAAMADAARAALRAYLTGVVHNKPREVRGAFALAEVPRMSLREGRWIAQARVRIRVDEIIGYGGY